ncbi:MAG TPA: 30S ribosome-binding factor RbfA [Lachnospiraceae bacterium]|nr:30S ribosome-binding factor RbfA [Lachnospiraceae bacterium]
MRKNSIKNNRINDAVKRELTEIIRREVKDPRISPMASVTSVNVAADLKTCKVAVSVLGDKKSKEDTMAGLKSSAGYIRRMLARNLNLRNTPELSFRLDESMEYAAKMSRMISDVMENDEKKRSEAEASGYVSQAVYDDDGNDPDEEGDF